MKRLTIEALKLKRSYACLTLLGLFIFFMFYLMVLFMSYYKKDSSNSSFLFYILIDNNSLFFSIGIAVFCSKLFSVELKGRALLNALSNGQTVWALYRNKLFFSVLIFSFFNLVELLGIVLMGMKLSIPISLAELGLQFFGVLLSCLALSTVQLYISLRFPQPVLSVAIGVFGAFVALLLARMPFFLSVLLPWGMLRLLSPATYLLKPGQVGRQVYGPSENLGLKFLLVILVILAYYLFVKFIIQKGEKNDQLRY